MAQRFRRSMAVGSVLFCCVDQIETRRQIWEAVQHRIDFFCDGRMGAEVLRVVTVSDSVSQHRYPETLFTAQEAFAGSCTAKSTIYCANVAAGLMLSQFAKWLRHLIVDFDCQLNLLSNELTVVEAASRADSQYLKGTQNHARPFVRQSDQPVPVV